jgi:hypothetical protein
MQTGSSGTLIGWKSGQTTFVPLWDRMEGGGGGGNGLRADFSIMYGMLPEIGSHHSVCTLSSIHSSH